MLLLSETLTTWLTEMAIWIAVNSTITIIYCNKHWSQQDLEPVVVLRIFFMFDGWNSQAKCTQSDNEKLPLLHKDWVSRQELLVSWKAECAGPMCMQEITLGLPEKDQNSDIMLSSDNEPWRLMILVQGGSHLVSGVCTFPLWERILPHYPHQVREG